MTAEHSERMASFRLPRAMWQAIVDHALDEAPRECCGVIAGANGRATELFRMGNVAPGNRHYEIDPQALFELEFQTLPARNSVVTAIYHSHPATEAFPSATDQAQAFWPDAIYLICSLARPAAPVIRGFRLGTAKVEEIAITIVDN